MGLMYQRHREFEVEKVAAEIVTPEIKPLQWSSRRLVLTDDASSSGLRVDLDPAEAGTFGQILHHDRSFGPIKVISPSWAALLQRIADDIDAGIYFYSEDLTWSRKGPFKTNNGTGYPTGIPIHRYLSPWKESGHDLAG